MNELLVFAGILYVILLWAEHPVAVFATRTIQVTCLIFVVIYCVVNL